MQHTYHLGHRDLERSRIAHVDLPSYHAMHDKWTFSVADALRVLLATHLVRIRDTTQLERAYR